MIQVYIKCNVNLRLILFRQRSQLCCADVDIFIHHLFAQHQSYKLSYDELEEKKRREELVVDWNREIFQFIKMGSPLFSIATLKKHPAVSFMDFYLFCEAIVWRECKSLIVIHILFWRCSVICLSMNLYNQQYSDLMIVRKTVISSCQSQPH